MSCPECNGELAEIDLERLRYYRCYVGHQYSPQSLEAAQREAVEAKLWAAAAALEEHAALARRLATRPGEALGEGVADGYRCLADRSSSRANSLLSGVQDKDVVLPPAHGGGPGATIDA
jgi:two-component system chemotaxis response regulator CheB